MKRSHVILIALVIFQFGMYGCNKEDDSIQMNSLSEKDYYPGSQELAKQEVLAFLNTTETYKKNQLKSEVTYEDREVSEGNWVMEAASNYLVNEHLLVSSNEKVLYLLSVENRRHENKIMMNGEDMVLQFDILFSDIYSHETNSDQKAKLIDFQIREVTQSRTDIAVYVVFGGPNGGLENQFPTSYLGLDESSQALEDEININYAASFGVIYQPNGGVTIGQWHSNVEILGGVRLGYSHMGGIDYGCGDCFFDNLQGIGTDSPNGCFPPSEYQNFYDKGIDVMNMAIAAHTSSSSYEFGLIACDYTYDICVCGSSSCDQQSLGAHMIEEVFIGVGNSY